MKLETPNESPGTHGDDLGDRASSRRAWVKALKNTLTVAVYCVVVALALRIVDVSVLRRVVRDVGLAHLVGVVSLGVLHITLRVVRYHALVRRTSASNYSIADGARISLSGIVAGLVTPGRVGDAVKAELLHKHGVRRATGLGLVAVERNLDLIAILGSMVIAGALISKSVRGPLAASAIGLAGLLALTAAATIPQIRRSLVLVVVRPARNLTKKNVAELIERLFDAWDEVFRSAGSAALLLGLTVGLWLVDFAKLWFLLVSAGEELTFVPVLFVYPLSLVAGLLSMLPFSEGVVGLTSVTLLERLAQVDVSVATICVVMDRSISTLVPVALHLIASVTRRWK